MIKPNAIDNFNIDIVNSVGWGASSTARLLPSH
jgi:hypothetical protein